MPSISSPSLRMMSCPRLHDRRVHRTRRRSVCTASRPAFAPLALRIYTLGQSDAKGAFLPRCQFSGDQQTGTLLDGNHILNVFYNGAYWSRLLTALDAANLFPTPMEKIGVLHQRLADLVMANPGVWRISHSDIFLGEDFDTPAVPAPAAGRGRGRGRGGPAVAAVPAIPGPQDLLFLTHLPLRALEVGGELPLLSYSLLSFHLGPTATKAARLPPAAPARLTAGLLQGGPLCRAWGRRPPTRR